jgi:hypothetical protein
MYERRSIFRDPKKQIFLAVLLAVVVFIFLLGRQGIANHVVISGDIAYLSVGRYGGVRILNIQNPAVPIEIGYYDTPGDAVRASFSGGYLYIADGRNGLRVLEMSDPAMPVVIGAVATQGSVQDLAIAGTYAYLALGEAGMAVVDISNPTRPLVVGGIETDGFAQRIALVSPSGGPITPELGGLGSPYIYLADGEVGMHVIDVRLPISPRIISTYTTPQEVFDVVVSGQLAVVAGGRDGVSLLNIIDPQFPMDYVAINPGGTTRSVAIDGSFVYVANGSGVSRIDFTNPQAPNIVSHYSTPGNARMVTVSGGHIYIADDNQGLRILDRANPFDPDLMGLYETPGEASFMQVVRSLGSIATGRWANVTGKVWSTLGIIIFDIILFFGVLFFWLFVFGQFVLPVRELTERAQVTSRLVSYFLGGHGAAIFIRNGKVIEGILEKHLRGPGVALLDTASGAVLRNAHAFTRPVGPGIVFTDGSEYIGGVVDLHRQSKSLGPSDEDQPFAAQKPNESIEAYNEVQKRRYQTSALTRDGVEVVPVISVLFKLTGEPGQGNSIFGYNPFSVWHAIGREAVNPDALIDENRHHVPWDWLPPYLAADLWREYLRKFTLDQLFGFAPLEKWDDGDHTHATAFNIILQMIHARLTQPEVENLDENGNRTSDKILSKEYRLLRRRGIQVMDVSVQDVQFHESVEQQLLKQWKATWLQRSQAERKKVEQMLIQKRAEGLDSADKGFALAVSQPLATRLKHNPKRSIGLPETLEELVQGTLRLVVREQDLQHRITNQKTGLIEIIEWIRKQ